MSCALPPPSGNGVGLLTRLRHTPLRDLLRGRLTGRLDWQRALEVSGLPLAAQVRVALTVRSTKLWRLEKAQVCDELIAHFADGLEAGESTEDLARNFGDPKRTAKLIRSAKKKLRPLWWHGWKWTLRGVGALIVVYAGLTLWYANDKVTIKVDYLAQLNAGALATPESERAWPMYRKGMLGWRELWEEGRYDEVKRPLNLVAAILCIREPIDPVADPSIRATAWTIIREGLAKHRDELDLFRSAAKKDHMGFMMCLGTSMEDYPLYGNPKNIPHVPPTPYKTGVFPAQEAGPSLLSVLVPHVGWMPQRVLLPLYADLEMASIQGDSSLVMANANALWGIYRQSREGPTLIEQLASLGILGETDRTLAKLIADPQGTAFNAAALEQLAFEAQKIAIPPLDLAGEKAWIQDTLQRYYTDDGHGHGHLTFGAADISASLFDGQPKDRLAGRVASSLILTAVSTLTASRQEEQRLVDAHFASLDLDMRTPPGAPSNHFSEQIGSAQLNDPIWRFRHPLTAIFLPLLGNARLSAARTQATHSALQLGIALHRHKLAHGDFPASLDALVPTYLKELPLDPITGGPLHYRRDAKGQPIVWSVGADRVDDGGLAPANHNGEADNRKAQNWYTPEEAKAAQRGDWILWPMSDLPVMPEK